MNDLDHINATVLKVRESDSFSYKYHECVYKCVKGSNNGSVVLVPDPRSGHSINVITKDIQLHQNENLEIKFACLITSWTGWTESENCPMLEVYKNKDIKYL